MTILYKKGLNVSSKDLDSLFKSIGWSSRGEKKWKEVLSKSTYLCTAWDKNKLIGMGRVLEDGVMCMLYDIAVHPNYQRKGIGSKIMEMLILQIKKKKYATIGLFAWKENPANIPFYEKHGFILKKNGMELEKYMVPE